MDWIFLLWRVEAKRISTEVDDYSWPTTAIENSLATPVIVVPLRGIPWYSVTVTFHRSLLPRQSCIDTEIRLRRQWAAARALQARGTCLANLNQAHLPKGYCMHRAVTLPLFSSPIWICILFFYFRSQRGLFYYGDELDLQRRWPHLLDDLSAPFPRSLLRRRSRSGYRSLSLGSSSRLSGFH